MTTLVQPLNKNTDGSLDRGATSAPAAQERPMGDKPVQSKPDTRQASPQQETSAPKKNDDASSPLLRFCATVFFIGTALLLWVGWQKRVEENLIAESGLGYALGIIGASLMILLLTYPLRKRARFMRNTGPVKQWFRVHMIMGVIGPVCIMFHANFSLGSTNSNFALFAMLLVAGSGLIGRYIYSKVHYGLYGGQVTLTSLRNDNDLARRKLSAEFAFAPQLRNQLKSFEEEILSASHSPLKRVLNWLTIGMRVRLTRWRLNTFIKRALTLRASQSEWDAKERRRHKRDARRFLNAYLRTVRKITELGFYERVFSFWHVLHVPLFIVLASAATVHIVAVHMY